MPYDEALADRLLALLADAPAVTQTRMFGGIAFFVRGNMCCGVHKSETIVRLDPERDAPKLKGLRPMDLTGKPMRGWFTLSAEASQSIATLRPLVRLAVEFAGSLPPKAKRPAKKRTPKTPTKAPPKTTRLAPRRARFRA
jgi:TfoX/Sxy family transcriptional regulator of competence genes